jgi:sugar phosphate isomerase/epimerase
MSDTPQRDLYFSYFMFTADLRPDDQDYAKVHAERAAKLAEMGYAGCDLPIAPTDIEDRKREVASYAKLKEAFVDAGVGRLKLTTNVGATRTYDPTSPYKEQRDGALAYLKSRVDITEVLGGGIMAGPIVFPYGVFPTTDANQPIWSDALQEWVKPRYRNAQPVLEELGHYAKEKGVKLGIEPVDHWETPSPNSVTEVLSFLKDVKCDHVGVCIDSAHVALGSDGVSVFDNEVKNRSEARRIHSVHISAPDRGAVHDSWIPWRLFLKPLLKSYDGPFLIEVFNAIPLFQSLLRLTRRKFWIPGEDAPVSDVPSAFDIAREAIATVKHEIRELHATA